MMRIATVTPADGLRLRTGPSTSDAIVRLLACGEVVRITAAVGAWRRVETDIEHGFVHGDYLTVDGTRSVNEEPAGTDPEISLEELERNEDRTGGSIERTYVVVAGDSLSIIGSRVGVDWRSIAALNGIGHPFPIFEGQLLRIPGAAVPTGSLDILNPLEFSGTTLVTSSSAQGHHTPYGGNRSCDLDIMGGVSPQTGARFNIRAPAGLEVRGVVFIIGPACRSGFISDGGHKVQVRIEYRRGPSGVWQSDGAWVLYGHLDPVLVSVDEVIAPGQLIGRLGASDGSEYNSSCAQGSHVHVEATNTSWVIDVDSQIGAMPVMSIGL